jgi:hypothetical protein
LPDGPAQAPQRGCRVGDPAKRGAPTSSTADRNAPDLLRWQTQPVWTGLRRSSRQLPGRSVKTCFKFHDSGLGRCLVTALRAGCSHETQRNLAGEAGLPGACAHYSDTLLGRTAIVRAEARSRTCGHASAERKWTATSGFALKSTVTHGVDGDYVRGAKCGVRSAGARCRVPGVGRTSRVQVLREALLWANSSSCAGCSAPGKADSEPAWSEQAQVPAPTGEPARPRRRQSPRPALLPRGEWLCRTTGPGCRSGGRATGFPCSRAPRPARPARPGRR